MKQRKVLIAIAVVIFILLLLYWLFVAEDINAYGCLLTKDLNLSY
ncbi:hypothetical protein NXY49_15975 [Bacteroides fragilis]|nr:hypothetical protein [Bacteroides fragilis]